MKKYTVVLIINTFPKLSESFLFQKFSGLVEKGWDIYVVCNHHDQKTSMSFPLGAKDKDLISRIHQNWPTIARWLPVFLFPLTFTKCLFLNPHGLLRYLVTGFKILGKKIYKRFYIDSQIIALKPDLVHFEFGATAVGRADIGTLLDCKVVVSFRGYDLNFSGLDQPDYYKDVWKCADGFHFLGNDLRQRGLRRGCSPEKPYALIPPAIEVEYFKPSLGKDYRDINDNRPLRILSVGRLEWKKGYEYGFQAIKELVEKGTPCEYHIIGDGAYLEPLAFTRHQLGLENTIKFLGAQQREKVKEELEWADVFLHAAVSEGFCNAVLEAQSMQVSVVCSDADGLSENVENGVTGFVVPRRNPEALAEKMAQLALSPELREQFGLAGRERVIREFELEDQIKKFESFYQQILSQNED